MWTSYNEPVLLARVWCLKASCSTEAGEFVATAASLKIAQKFAEEADDVALLLCTMSNRAICEIRLGDCKAAATLARRAFVKAEAENEPEMIFKTQCIRYVPLLTAWKEVDSPTRSRRVAAYS